MGNGNSIIKEIDKLSGFTNHLNLDRQDVYHTTDKRTVNEEFGEEYGFAHKNGRPKVEHFLRGYEGEFYEKLAISMKGGYSNDSRFSLTRNSPRIIKPDIVYIDKDFNPTKFGECKTSVVGSQQKFGSVQVAKYAQWALDEGYEFDHFLFLHNVKGLLTSGYGSDLNLLLDTIRKNLISCSNLPFPLVLQFFLNPNNKYSGTLYDYRDPDSNGRGYRNHPRFICFIKHTS